MTPSRFHVAAIVLSVLSIGALCVVTSAPTAKEPAAKSDAAPAKTEAAKPETNRVEIPLNGHTFSLPEGFTIELVAGPPLVNRPITASFDEDGRLYVSDSSGTNDPSAKQLIDKPHRVVRLEDTDGDGKFDKSVVFADKLMFPEGTLWYDGSLYVAAPPSIWKLTDTDGDGVADQREEWFKGNTLTGCANDLHGPYLGPDGYLYWCKGAFAEQTYDRPVKLTRSASEGERSKTPNQPEGASPRFGTPNDSTNRGDTNSRQDSTNRGLAPSGSEVDARIETKPWVTKASHIFRARPDAPRDPETGSIQTSAVEAVMTGGMDNPVDVVFTPTGERIFTTTFLVHPGQGNRDGLLHAVYGGVYGKDWNVIDSPSHPRTGDVMPVLCHLGAAAPCGLERLQSAAWGREYQDNLFACCFNMRKVTRHVLTPQGATFACATTDFVVSNNLDFHPTDVLEDADGSLLIVDTGGWYKLCCPTSQLWKPDVLGAIYRVKRKSTEVVGSQIDPLSNWKAARTILHFELSPSRHQVRRLIDLILRDNRYLRERATQKLTRYGDMPVKSIEAALSKSKLPTSQLLPLVWALGRIEHHSTRTAMRGLLRDERPEVRQIALHYISLWHDQDALSDVGEDFVHGSPRLKRAVAEVFGRIGNSHATKTILWFSHDFSGDRFLEHSITYALIELGDAELLREAITYACTPMGSVTLTVGKEKVKIPGAGSALSLNPACLRMALIALDQMPNGGLRPEEVAKYLTSPEPLLRETAAWIISRHADWGEALAGYLRERLAAPVTRSVSEGERSVGLTDAEQTTLGKQLAQFAKAASVQDLLAATVRSHAERGNELPSSARLTALRAMRDSGLKELPKSWTAALLSVLSTSRSHALRGNASTDAPRPVQDTASKPDAERQDVRSHAERGNELELIELALKTARAIPPHKDDAAAWREPLLAIATRSHAPRGNAASDAPRPVQSAASKPDAERQNVRSHAERGNEERWTSIRLDALAALPGGLAAKEADGKLFDFVLSQLAPELTVAQRGTAAEILSKSKLSKPQLEKLTEQFATAGPLEVDRLLGAFEQTTDEQIGQKLVAALKTAPALTALRADAIKTRLAKYSPSVQEAAQPLYAALNVDLGQQRKQLEETLASLPPGDIVRGQKIFHNEKAACKACHAIGYLGGKTGPDLTRIGGIRNDRDLLESILFPSASFVRSFEPVMIETKSGKVINGLIRSETPDELVLATGPNQEARVARADIEELKPSNVSIMPAGLEKQISPQQLADLIAFLKACK